MEQGNGLFPSLIVIGQIHAEKIADVVVAIDDVEKISCRHAFPRRATLNERLSHNLVLFIRKGQIWLKAFLSDCAITTPASKIREYAGHWERW